MNSLRRIHILLLVIRASLLPKVKGIDKFTTTSPETEKAGADEFIRVPPESIPLYLTHLDHLAAERGSIALFIPDCPAMAAPFILFRLKRSGFSNCRALADNLGLKLTASR